MLDTDTRGQGSHRTVQAGPAAGSLAPREGLHVSLDTASARQWYRTGWILGVMSVYCWPGALGLHRDPLSWHASADKAKPPVTSDTTGSGLGRPERCSPAQHGSPWGPLLQTPASLGH